MRKVIFLNEKDVHTLQDFYKMMVTFKQISGYGEVDEVWVDILKLATKVTKEEYPQNCYVGSVQVFCEKELK